jgi:hypothetical protein
LSRRARRNQLPHDLDTVGDGRAQHRPNDGSAHRPKGCKRDATCPSSSTQHGRTSRQAHPS